MNGRMKTLVLAGAGMLALTSTLVLAQDAPESLLVPLRNARGHDLGWIGLTAAADTPLPDPGQIAAQVRRLTRDSDDIEGDAA